MNILFFYLPAIAPSRGGIERVTAVLSDEMEARGHRCFYLATLSENSDVADKQRQFFLPDTSNLHNPENLDFYKKLLVQLKIDVVVYQAAHKKFPFKKFTGHPPLICSLHLDPCADEAIAQDKFELRRSTNAITTNFSKIILALKIKLRRLKKKRVYRWNYALCEKYIILSDSYTKPLVEHLANGDTAQKIIAIPNPLSIPALKNIPEKEKCLLFIGRLCFTQKRPDLMLRIWKSLENKFPDWHLEMLGNGSDEDAIKHLAQDLELKRVYFRGFTTPEPYLGKAPILCMTSSNEGFPLVLGEASAFGCIPVAFNSFAVASDIISDGENGFLIPAFDLKRYAQKLAELMTEIPSDIVENAKKNATRYTLDNIVPKWISLFEELTKRDSSLS